MKKLSIWMVVLLILWLVMTCAFLAIAPDRVPVHFGPSGEVDRWGSKYEYLVFMGIGAFVTVMPVLGNKFGFKKMWEGNEKLLPVVSISISVFFLLLSGFFMWKALDPETLTNGLSQLAMKSVVILLMVLFIILGNLTPKARRNSNFGLRIKWSKYNDTCWQKSQRISGFAMTASGVVGLILGILLPESWAMWVPLALVGVALVVSIVGSYCVYRREIDKQ